MAKKRMRCSYCGSTRNIQDEHVVAKTKGGKATIPACRACNSAKQDKAPMEFIRSVRDNDSYRWRKMLSWNARKRNPIAQKVHKVRDEKKQR